MFQSLKNYDAENPELFQDTPDLAEDFDSPICLAYTTAKIVTIFKNVIPCSWQRYSWKLMLLTQLNLKSFKKKKEASSSCHALHWPCFVYHVMLCFGYALFWPCHASLDKICTKDKNSQLYNWFPTFWRQKGEIHYSLVTIHYHYSSITIHDTVHSEFLPM